MHLVLRWIKRLMMPFKPGYLQYAIDLIFLTGWRIWRETSFTRNRSRIFNRFKIRPVQCEHSVIVQFHAPKQPHSIGNCNAYKIFKYFVIYLFVCIFLSRSRKPRMASFLDPEGSTIKELNIQRKAINGSQVRWFILSQIYKQARSVGLISNSPFWLLYICLDVK